MVRDIIRVAELATVCETPAMLSEQGRFRQPERMGPKLLAEVSRQLLHDLTHYGVEPAGLSIDWSEICLEGHSSFCIDGVIENYSYVGILDSDGGLIGNGWMDFVHQDGMCPLQVYWDFLTINNVRLKNKPGIPAQVWKQLPEEARKFYASCRMRE